MQSKELPECHDYEFAALTDLVEICKGFEKRQMGMIDEIDDEAFCRTMEYLASRFPFIAANTQE